MSENCKIQLNASSVIGVSLEVPNNEFSFIINGETYRTFRFISDILSAKISRIHLNDPNYSKISIDTRQKGDFTILLNLLDFQQHEIQEKDIPFILEIINALENKEIDLFDENNETNITNDNIFELVQKHNQYGNLYSKNLIQDINYLSSHFYELCEDHQEDFSEYDVDLLARIIDNQNLRLINEDQLLIFINEICKKNDAYSKLYEYVYFIKVSKKLINEFTKCIDMKNITIQIWRRICACLKDEKMREEDGVELPKKERYSSNGLIFTDDDEKSLSGIFTFLNERSNGKIDDEINLTVSGRRDDLRLPKYAYPFEDTNICFASANIINSWICFDFKDKKVSPTCYKIRASNDPPNIWNMRNWVVECSNDNSNWQIIDKQNNCHYLNGNGAIHSFPINIENSLDFRYIRVRSTGQNWNGTMYLAMYSFEIYGKITQC